MKNEITAKFKDSPLGPIPQDWEVKLLGDCWDSFRTGPFGSALHAHDYVENGTPIINPMHINGGKIHPSSDMCVDEPTRNRLSSYVLSVDEIIIGRRGEMGRAALVTEKESGWLCGTGCFVLQMKDSVNADYIARYIATPQCVNTLEANAIGTTIINLNQTILSDVPILCPPLPEQQRIAETLGEMDSLIESLDVQIEKKRLVAKGVAHDLLGMRNEECGMMNEPIRRLPGFKGEWVKKRLGEVGIWLKGQPLSKVVMSAHGEHECIHYGELFTKYGPVIVSPVSRTTCEVTVVSKCGDILFPSSDVTPEGLGRCSAILKDNVILGGDMIILRPVKEVSPEFISYFVNLNKCKIIAKVTGITVRHVTSKALSTLEITIPPTIAEQRAIAETLLEMDAAIAALEAKREKYMRIKEGMMRDLLSGKKRLKGE